MRPRKVVLLACDDDVRSSILSLVLDCRGYRVVTMGPLMSVPVADAALVIGGPSSVAAVHAITDAYPEMPILALLKRAMDSHKYPAGRFRWVVDPPMADVLEDLHTAIARRRGPKRRLLVMPQMLEMLRI